MVNDTNTLNGSLMELGENIATNLTTKGVEADASDGLTTLSDKILDIQTSQPKPSLVIVYDSTNNRTINCPGTRHFVYKEEYPEGEVDWGDGTSGAVELGRLKHTYSSDGVFLIKVYGVSEIVPNTSNQQYSLFYGVRGIKSIFINEDVENVGDMAIYNSSVISIIFEPQCSSVIGSNAFAHNSNLINVVLPEGATSLGESCFNACTSLESIDIPKSVTSFGSHCFTRTNISEISISQATNVGSSLFYGCPLTDLVDLPNLSSLPAQTYFSCGKLTEITIPGYYTSIGSSCFEKCRGLTDVYIEEGVEVIGSRCFADCETIENIHFPSTITTIPTYCFMASSVDNYHLYWTSSPLAYNSNVMPNGSDTKFYIPQGTTSIYTSAGYPSAKLVERTE